MDYTRKRPSRMLPLAVAAVGFILFAPRLLEGTPTSCGAVRSQVVAMMMKRVTADDMSQMEKEVPGSPPEDIAHEIVRAVLREQFAKKVRPMLAIDDWPWFKCSLLYWVNELNPIPESDGD